MFKICVSIFAFITGYGLLKSFVFNKYKIKNTYKWISTRIIKTFSGFWIIALLSYIVCQIVDKMTFRVFFSNGILSGIINIIINFFGLSFIFRTPEINATWYMSLALLFIFLIPILINVKQKYGYMIIVITVIFVPRVLNIYNTFICFIFPMILGMICADKKIIQKVSNFHIIKNNIINKILKFIIGLSIGIILYKIYPKLQSDILWELKFGIIPLYFICFLYEFILQIPILKNILYFLGKHSMNIFLIHDFIRTTYLTDFLYSFKHFALIVFVLLIISLLISILVELFKKLIRYNKIIEKINTNMIKKIDSLNY